jgi:WD40 repeat protein
VLAVAWRPGAPVLATAGHDGTARLLETATGRALATMPGTGGWVEHLAWSPDGRTLATASGRVLRFWHADGTPRLETPPHDSTITALAWSRDGTEVAATCYGGVNFWSPAAGARVRHLAWKGSLISLAWSPDGKVVAAGSQDCSVHFWRLATERDSEITGYPFKPKALAWDARSTLLATGGDAEIMAWDFAGSGPEGTKPRRLKAHQAVVTALAFGPRKGTLASGAQDTGVILWEPRRSTSPVAYGFARDAISALAWHPTQALVAAADASGQLVVWRTP